MATPPPDDGGAQHPEISLTDLPEWEALHRATEALYDAFSSYPLRATISYCTHCLSEAFDAELHAQPLRELSADTACTILANPGTWGDEVDVKHFLPRLFELVSLDLVGPPSGLGLYAETLGRRVDSEGKGFTGWPESERAALTAFCLAWLRAALATWPSSPFVGDETVETVLCAIAQFTDDFAPYLAACNEAMSSGTALAPVAHFLGLTCRYVTQGVRIPPDNVWWDTRQAYWHQMVAWIEDPVTSRIAQHALERAQAAGERIDAESLDAKYPLEVDEALEWIASWAQEVMR